MVTQQKFAGCIFVLATLSAIFISCTQSLPMPSQNSGYINDLEEIPDDVFMELLARFGQTILRTRNDIENTKRTVDFGLTRGYSGTSEARHRMGMASANSPAGPGRRRRSETDI